MPCWCSCKLPSLFSFAKSCSRVLQTVASKLKDLKNDHMKFFSAEKEARNLWWVPLFKLAWKILSPSRGVMRSTYIILFPAHQGPIMVQYLSNFDRDFIFEKFIVLEGYISALKPTASGHFPILSTDRASERERGEASEKYWGSGHCASWFWSVKVKRKETKRIE